VKDNEYKRYDVNGVNLSVTVSFCSFRSSAPITCYVFSFWLVGVFFLNPKKGRVNYILVLRVYQH
jgi:hypothetical protein